MSQLASSSTESEKMEAGLTTGNTESCWVSGSWDRGPTAGCLSPLAAKLRVSVHQDATVLCIWTRPEPAGGHWEAAG